MASDKRYGGGIRRTSGEEVFIGKVRIKTPGGIEAEFEDVKIITGDTLSMVAADAEEYKIGAQAIAHMVPEQFEKSQSVSLIAAQPPKLPAGYRLTSDPPTALPVYRRPPALRLPSQPPPAPALLPPPERRRS